MVSLDDQSFDNIFTSHDMHDYSRYPEPPHSASSYDTSNTSPMDMGSLYGLPQPVGFDQSSLYAEASNYMVHHNRGSPAMCADEVDMRNTLMSSSLSTNSATSSAAASPQSNHSHHMGPGPEWHPHSLHPSIVGNDYIASHEYSGFPNSGMDEYYEFAQTKTFVGKFRPFLWFTPSSFSLAVLKWPAPASAPASGQSCSRTVSRAVISVPHPFRGLVSRMLHPHNHGHARIRTDSIQSLGLVLLLAVWLDAAILEVRPPETLWRGTCSGAEPHCNASCMHRASATPGPAGFDVVAALLWFCL